MIRHLLVSGLVVTVLACSGAPTPVAITQPSSPSPGPSVSPAPSDTKHIVLSEVKKKPRYGCFFQVGGQTVFTTIDGLDKNGQDAAMLGADGQDRKLVMTGNIRIEPQGWKMTYSGGGYSVSYQGEGDNDPTLVLTITGPGGSETVDASRSCEDGGPLG